MARLNRLVPVEGLEALEGRYLQRLAVGRPHGVVKVEEPRAHADRQVPPCEFDTRKGGLCHIGSAMGLALGARNHEGQKAQNDLHIPGLVRVEKGGPRFADAFGEEVEKGPERRAPRLGLAVGLSGLGQQGLNALFFATPAPHLAEREDLFLDKINTRA